MSLRKGLLESAEGIQNAKDTFFIISLREQGKPNLPFPGKGDNTLLLGFHKG